MTRHEFFKKRLREMGLYDVDADYKGMIGKNVEELSETFMNQAYSGGSMTVTLALINQLMREWDRDYMEAGG